MKPYVDGFLIPIKKDKIDSYTTIATKAGELWMKHGALGYYECIGEDLRPFVPEEMKDCLPEGADPNTATFSSFPQIADLKEDETVLFSFIIFASKEDRDEINKKVMEDPEMQEGPEDMPFDITRMCYGGFDTIVALQK